MLTPCTTTTRALKVVQSRMERRMITMRYTRRRRGSDFLHTSILLFVLLLIISCLCGGAFIRSSVTNSRHPWIPHNGDGGCSPSLSSPLYAQKSPYRLGVYPYKDNDKHDKKKKHKETTVELDELVNQHKLEQGANVNVNDTTNVVSNHTLLLQQQQQQQEDDFILQAPKSNTSQIIDSFLNATSMNVTSSSNETTTTLHNNNKAQATIKAKKRPSVLLSPSQHFFSAFTYDMTAPKLKQEKKVNTTKTTTTIADSILANKNPNDVLTVADLEAILQDRGYVRESQQQPTQRGSSKGKTTSSTRKSSSVAFPQQSVLSYKDLTVGSTVAAGFLGMLLGITIFPNLWLIGMVLGSLYGYEISKDYQTKPPTFPLARLIVGMGRKLAKVYLKCYDTMYGIWFMYKTGQLSYEYYKRYSKLDDRFGLSEKMDAWNARFIQGKKNFDAWEQENEIGRRVLAGFRTAWLVEEKRCVWCMLFRAAELFATCLLFYYDVVVWQCRVSACVLPLLLLQSIARSWLALLSARTNRFDSSTRVGSLTAPLEPLVLTRTIHSLTRSEQRRQRQQ